MLYKLFLHFKVIMKICFAVCAGAGYGVIKLQNKRRREIKLKKDNTGKNFDKLCKFFSCNSAQCVVVQ